MNARHRWWGLLTSICAFLLLSCWGVQWRLAHPPLSFIDEVERPKMQQATQVQFCGPGRCQDLPVDEWKALVGDFFIQPELTDSDDSPSTYCVIKLPPKPNGRPRGLEFSLNIKNKWGSYHFYDDSPNTPFKLSTDHSMHPSTVKRLIAWLQSHPQQLQELLDPSTLPDVVVE